MKTIVNAALIIFTVVMMSCEKRDKNPAHPLAGEWNVKNVESQKYLAFTDDASRPAFDIGRGASSLMKVIPGPKPGQYYIATKADVDIYLSTNGAIYTYVMGTNFSNSDADLFTFVPINEGSDRYNIQSVANPSLYLVSCYSCYGRSSTLSISYMSKGYWDAIWILEKP